MSDASRQARRTKRAAGEVASVQRNELGTGEDWSEARASASERGLDASEASTKCEYIACVWRLRVQMSAGRCLPVG